MTVETKSVKFQPTREAEVVDPTGKVPFEDRKLTLGTWQQIVFVEFGVRSRDRTVVVQMMGD